MPRPVALAFVVCLASVAESCPDANASSGQDGIAPVPSEYRMLYRAGISMELVPEVWAGFPYDSIELERTACFGTCPVYRVKLFRGGKAELHRVQFTAPLGEFVGEVSIFDYGRLCYLLEKSGFDALPARYTADWTDAPTAIVTTTSGGNMKVVSEYSGVGPIELWAVQQAIDAVAARIEWTPK